MSRWTEVGDHVFVRRYEFFDQNIVAVVGEGGVLVVDTRSTYAQARELIDDLRTLTSDPWIVLNTHHHFDHTYGNALFQPAEIWGHDRCAEVLREDGERHRAALSEEMPELRGSFAEIEIVPPNRTLAEGASVSVGGREVSVRYLGRGHTDNDVVAVIPGAGVTVMGDLIEEGGPPYFGDSFPLDWPGTLAAALGLLSGAVVPGHGSLVDGGYVEKQMEEIAAAATAVERVRAEGGSVEEAAAAIEGYPREVARTIAERAFLQLSSAV